MDVRGPLQELLIGLAHGRLDGAAYRAGHQEVVARALSEWGRHAELRDFAWRLPYYCLDGEESWDASPAGRSLAEVAFEFLLREPLGPSERRDLAQRLRGELFILDQLNSVTWSYGVRTRQGKDCWRFTPIIPAGVPIDPGRRFSRCLGAAVEGQEWVRIELSTAEPGAERVRPEGFLLARRLRLPRAAQRGERFWLHLERQGERGLRLLLELEGEEGEAGGGSRESCWTLEDEEGFAELAESVATRPLPRPRSGPEEELRRALEAGQRTLNQFWELLSEDDARQLVAWVLEASAALGRKDEAAMEAALRGLLVQLQQVPGAGGVLLDRLLAILETRGELDEASRLLFERLLGDGAGGSMAWLELEWELEGQLTTLAVTAKTQPPGAQLRVEILRELLRALVAAQSFDSEFIRPLAGSEQAWAATTGVADDLESFSQLHLLIEASQAALKARSDRLRSLEKRSGREDEYRLEGLASLLAPYQAELPAELQELLRQWQPGPPKQAPRTAWRRWIGGYRSRLPTALPPEADELLSEVEPGLEELE